MARHRYLIQHENGFKRFVSQADIDLLGSLLERRGPREYFCAIPMPELRQITSGPNYLGLEVVFDYPPDREYENEQTPRGMIARLEQMGFVAEATGWEPGLSA